MRSAWAIAIGLAGALAMTTPSSSVLGWDVTATYDFGDDSGPVTFALDGLYSQIIGCPDGWNEVSSSASSTPNPSHIVTYAWSYVRGEILFEEQLNGSVQGTVHQCASAQLAPAGASFDDGWVGVELQAGTVPHTGCDHVIRQVMSTAGLLWGSQGWDELTGVSMGDVDGLCFKMEGVTIEHPEPEFVPFTGFIDGQVVRKADMRLLAEGHTCSMVVGECWSGSKANRYASDPLCVDLACEMLPKCAIKGPLTIGRAVGTWRCVLEAV